MLEPIVLDPSQIAPETVRPLRRREYDHLVEAGAFADERLELLRGALVTMSPQKWRHATVTAELTQQLTLALGKRFLVRPQLPLAVSDDSEPEPDVVVVPAGAGRGEHPTTALLVIEVADSSLRKDRDTKALIYAEAGLEEYWIVDLQRDCVWVHTEPSPTGYRQRRQVGRDGALRPTALAPVELRVADFLVEDAGVR